MLIIVQIFNNKFNIAENSFFFYEQKKLNKKG